MMFKKRKSRIGRRFLAFLVSVLVIITATGVCFLPLRGVLAASLTSKSDSLSRLQKSVAANHTITFTTPTGVAAGETITVTFPAGFSMGSVNFTDIDMAVGGSDVALAATPSGSTWGAAVSGQVLTLTSGTGTISASSVVTIEIGTNATYGTTGDQQITNPSTAGVYEISLGGTMADSGQLKVQILDDDTVRVTADVDESIAFAITDVEIGFGTLDYNNARYATGDGNGSGTKTSAHNLTVATNASGGWSVAYTDSQSLTCGSEEIDAATISGDADGTPGSEQFALSFSTSGSATITSAYSSSSNNWKYEKNPASPVTIASKTSPNSTETISAYYLANISALTPAGSYSTDITYLATATF